MEVKKTLIAKYSQVGHPQYPEDTWESERAISTTEELFEYMKDLYRQDARHFSDFPMNGNISMNRFSFVVEKSVEIDGELYICKDRIHVNNPDFFEATEGAKKMFKEFIERVKRTLPVLRLAENKKETEIREKAKLAELKEKWGD